MSFPSLFPSESIFSSIGQIEFLVYKQQCERLPLINYGDPKDPKQDMLYLSAGLVASLSFIFFILAATLLSCQDKELVLRRGKDQRKQISFFSVPVSVTPLFLFEETPTTQRMHSEGACVAVRYTGA